MAPARYKAPAWSISSMTGCRRSTASTNRRTAIAAWAICWCWRWSTRRGNGACLMSISAILSRRARRWHTRRASIRSRVWNPGAGAGLSDEVAPRRRSARPDLPTDRRRSQKHHLLYVRLPLRHHGASQGRWHPLHRGQSRPSGQSRRAVRQGRRRRFVLHDAGGALGAQHAVIDRMGALALDVADATVLEMHRDAAAAGAHIAGGVFDFVADRLVSRDGRIAVAARPHPIIRRQPPGSRPSSGWKRALYAIFELSWIR